MDWHLFSSCVLLGVLLLLPLILKWELDRRLALPATLIVAALSAAATTRLATVLSLDFLSSLLGAALLTLVLAGGLLLWRFYRDPDRIPPPQENTILSPADGTIIYLKKYEDGQIPCSKKQDRRFPLSDFAGSGIFKGGGYLIGISMSYLDVHVNRAPIAGDVILLKHISGLFLSLKRREALLRNERVLTVIENNLLKVGVVQIASRLVRKIVPYVREGQAIQRGARIGTIRFGSQVDVIVPALPSLTIRIVPGTKAHAGVTVLATF